MGDELFQDIEDLDELYARQMRELSELTTSTVIFMMRRRQDRLANIEEHEMPRSIRRFEEVLVRAARDTLQERGVL